MLLIDDAVYLISQIFGSNLATLNTEIQKKADDDVGQENADLVGEDLANTISLNSSYFSGTAKYDKIGSMVVVYVNVTTSSSISSNRRIDSSAISSDYRPSSAQTETVRSYTTASLRVTTGGYLYLDYNGNTIPSGTAIKGEVCFFV